MRLGLKSFFELLYKTANAKCLALLLIHADMCSIKVCLITSFNHQVASEIRATRVENFILKLFNRKFRHDVVKSSTFERNNALVQLINTDVLTPGEGATDYGAGSEGRRVDCQQVQQQEVAPVGIRTSS